MLKDYSVYTIDNALIVFEKEKLIDEDESFKIISRLMEQSEKGIFHLLTSYVNQKDDLYIKKLIKRRYFSDSNNAIRFWELDSALLDCFDKADMSKQLTELLRSHYYSKNIEFRDLATAMQSKYKDMVLDGIEYFEYSIMSPNKDLLSELDSRGINYLSDKDKDDGKQKDIGKSVIFASVATLGRSEYLTDEYFAPDYFTYLVIDEFHHAVTDQYQRIVNYFKPQFMLGLTATPERMDGKSIYEICDYNVPYEITLKEAINKGALVPFHYYGIYDETDYSTLKLVKGRYDEKDLNDKYIGNVKRYDLIYKHYKKYRSKRALGFCSSRMHAEEMAKEFCKRGIKSVAVYSNADGEFSEERNVAIEQLKNQEIKSMPIKFLKASGKGFFIDKDGYALGIRDELADVIKVDAFKEQMKDIIEYRTMEYYRRRYVEN